MGEVDAGGVPCRHRHRPGHRLGLRPIAGPRKAGRPLPKLAWRALPALRLPSVARVRQLRFVPSSISALRPPGKSDFPSTYWRRIGPSSPLREPSRILLELNEAKRSTIGDDRLHGKLELGETKKDVVAQRADCTCPKTLFWRPRSDNGRENQPRRFLRWATLPPSPKEIPL